MRALRVLLPALLLLVTTATPAHAAAIGRYVALGDSYAVAVGTRIYDDAANDTCRRGPLAYSRLWAAAHPATQFVEASCSGAKVADMPSQLSALTADTNLVTVQVGGNDAGFVDVLVNCIFTISDQDCVNRVNQAKAVMTGTLPAALQTLYADIRRAAPNAKVVVVGYPRLYKINGNCGIFGLSDTERTALNSGSDTMADVVSAQAAAAGFSYIDTRNTFAGHEICASAAAWMTSLEWDKINESYHPNTQGHAAVKAALTAITG